MWRRGVWIPFALLIGCTPPEGPDSARDSTEQVPLDAVPCSLMEMWPHSLASEERPAVVHFREASDDYIAKDVLKHLELAWSKEVDEMGFRPPPPDKGLCGFDDRFDVFLWKGRGDAYVDVIGEDPETPIADQIPYMTIDAWGPYAGDLLKATVVHEFNHACQAAYDWSEAGILFEMTSTFMEDVVAHDDDYKSLLVDFQSRPDWSLDRNDNYRTWYMYASVLYLFYLRDAHFDGDPSFTAEMWERSASGSENEPDFEDALEAMLQEKSGIGFLDSVVQFARWRWYTGDRDDGKHFAQGATFPDDAEVKTIKVNAKDPRTVALDDAPMMLGNGYLKVRGAEGATDVGVEILSKAAGVRWVVQAVPGLDDESDGAELMPGDRLKLTPEGTRTLILTALPEDENDPDERTDKRYPVSVAFTP